MSLVDSLQDQKLRLRSQVKALEKVIKFLQDERRVEEAKIGELLNKRGHIEAQHQAMESAKKDFKKQRQEADSKLLQKNKDLIALQKSIRSEQEILNKTKREIEERQNQLTDRMTAFENLKGKK